MTIACGLKFSEGVLVSADTEMTYGGELKDRASKIFAYEFESNGGGRAVFTYSGAAHYAKMAIQECERVLRQKPEEEMTRLGMLNAVGNHLYEFHHRHIPAPFYQAIGGPDFSLILSLWSRRDGLGLYETSGDAMIEVVDDDMYACTGAGETLARYLLHSLMMRPHHSLVDIRTDQQHSYSATVKSWVPGCGGGSGVDILWQKKATGGIGWIRYVHVNPLSQAFQQSMKQLFLRACNLEQLPTQGDRGTHRYVCQCRSRRYGNHCKSDIQREGGSLRNLTRGFDRPQG